MNIGFLASHGGTNLQAILDACKQGVLAANPALIISNNRQSGALARARQEGLPHALINSVTHPDAAVRDRAICTTLVAHQVELIVLAGYMKKIGPQTLQRFRGRILNIHPALLPKYGGQGMYGRNVHEAVLAAGERETGVTIHLIDEAYDTGPILAQATVPVELGDTADSLAARVLAREHTFFVETIARILSGELQLASVVDSPNKGTVR